MMDAPPPSPAAQKALIDQIRAQLKEVQIQHSGELLAAPTLSAGIAQADEHNFDPGELLRAADKALYSAKNAGRDRVIRYGANAKGDRPKKKQAEDC